MNRYQTIHLADGEKITWDRIQGAITGSADPLKFPVSYPAIDLDPATKKTVINASLIIAGAIVAGSLLRAKIG